jgi:hypothetical protein
MKVFRMMFFGIIMFIFSACGLHTPTRAERTTEISAFVTSPGGDIITSATLKRTERSYLLAYGDRSSTDTLKVTPGKVEAVSHTDMKKSSFSTIVSFIAGAITMILKGT